MRALIVMLLLATPGLAADWPAEVEKQLAKAGDNRSELEAALKGVPADQRKGMEFLVANMPDRDLTALKADFLLKNHSLAYKARAEMPWGKAIPEEIFFNNVLPYANIDEKREPWRQEFYDLCKPLVKECKNPSEVTQVLNKQLYPKLKLRYAPQRRAPNLSPSESIQQGTASCTGLSIVLSDACRSVGVPTRLVGTPNWSDKRGNHTWIEIWDERWHFTGACEPDPNGLDRGWFVGDASRAQKDNPEHAIFASSFRKTDTHFPLVWARSNKTVPGENVTDNYAKKAEKTETVRVYIRVLGSDRKRTVTSVKVAGNKQTFEGKSRGESADLNDLLSFELRPETEYTVTVGDTMKSFTTGKIGTPLTVEIVTPK